MSKVLEKEVFRQVYGYLTENCMLLKFQTGFLPKLSTVTALIQMCDEWLENKSNGKLNGVIFLDVKRAFDSINHFILLTKMKKCFGISSIELKWFESYLSNRDQLCSINEQLYHPRKQAPVASLRALYWVHCCSYDLLLMTCLSV